MALPSLIHVLRLAALAILLVSLPGKGEEAAPSAYVFDENSYRIPRVLSDRDIKRYREIMDLQQDGKWKRADKLIGKLHNDLLLGHILYQRYMHPTKYRSKYTELSDWMQKYADLPGARRIYSLAKKRQGRARAPKSPAQTRYPGVTGMSAKPSPPIPGRSKAERKAVNRFKANVRRYVRRGQSGRAEKRYFAMAARDLLTPHEAASALERIAASYYYEGNDFKAYALANLAAELSRVTEPGADWVAGLASWRRGQFDNAFEHFKAVSENERAHGWLTSAGYFWAARAANQLGESEKAIDLLRSASQFRETFYGLIAARQLGLDLRFDWSLPELDGAELNKLLTYPSVLRAIALSEIGRDDLADEELRLLWGRHGVAVQKPLLALSAALNLPAVQVRLGRVGGTGEHVPISVRYPLPDWEPVDGLRLDRAFLFAIVRKESDFQIRAHSYAGARGLMQVMPATASWISKDRSLFRRNRSKLYEPEFNMALGQLYIEHLLEADYVEDNLFMLLAAYNGGPGSLIGWQRDVDYQQDPLLFIESIGFYQTRDYIERVMTYLWLYRLRLGQDTPSLDVTAALAWPKLEHLDSPAAKRIKARRRARITGRTRLLFNDE